MTPAPRQKPAPRQNALFPSQLLAANVRAARALLDLSQQDLAERMSALGYTWSRPTVSQVERAARTVSVDELFGLVHALKVDIRMLLTPPKGSDVHLDTGLPQLLHPEGVRGVMDNDSPYTPTVVWEGNKPTSVSYPGSMLLEEVLRLGGSPGQVAFFKNMLEQTKRAEEER